MPDSYQGHALVHSSNHLFHTGGISGTMGIPDGTKVFSAPASESGTVGAWTARAPLPEAVFYHAGVAVNGHLFVLGGFHYTDADGMVVSNTVYRAAAGADGSVGAWQTATALPEAVFFPSAAVWNGRIYVTGGWNGAALVNRVYSAAVNADGSLGPWVAQKSLPEAVYTHAAVSNGTLYVLGGTVNGGNDIHNTVYFAKIEADGSLADWAATTPLPSPVSNHGAVVANGRVLVMGGWTGAAPTAEVQSAAVEGAGGLGPWSTEAPLPRALYLGASAASATQLFFTGGIDPESMRGEVYSTPLPAAPPPPPPPLPTDTLPPRTTLAFGSPFFGGAPFISPRTPATLSAVDDALAVGDGAGVGVAATRWALDEGGFTDYAAPITVAADGAHWIRYRSVDALGAEEEVRASSAVVDGTPPVSTLSIGAPQAVLATGEIVVGPATVLAASAEDPAVNGAASGAASALVKTGEGAYAVELVLPAVDGPHAVLTKAIDNVGNEETPRATTVHRDSRAPNTTLALSTPAYAPAGGGAPIVGAAHTVAFTAADAGAAGVHHTEYALDGGAVQVYTGAFGLDEGARALAYRSVDSVGNAENWVSASFRSDATLPQSTLTWEGAPTSRTDFSISAIDPESNGVASGVSRVLYSVDGGEERAFAGAFRLAEGARTIRHRAMDNAGNAEEARETVVTVGAADELPPRTTLAFGAPSFGPVPFISPATPATLSAADDALVVGDAAGVGVASTQWALDDGAFAEYAGPIRIATDGVHWIRYASVDAAGRAEAVRASSAAVDGTPPASTLAIGSPRAMLASGETIVGPDTALAVSAVDPVVNGAASGVAWTRAGVDGAAPAPVTGPFLLPAVDGAHAVVVQAADNVGNEEAPRSVTIHRDGAAPATTLAFSAAPNAGAIYGAGLALSFTAVDAAAGVNRTEYAFDGGAAAVYTGPFGVAEGVHALVYRSFDNVGNAEAERTVSITVDATPPLTALSVEGGSTLFGEDVAAAGSATALTASDPVSGGVASGVERIVYSVDGGPDQIYAAPLHLGAGRHTISFGAVDRAGNAEARRTVAVSEGSFMSAAVTGLESVTLSGGAAVTGDVTAPAVTLKGNSSVAGTITRGPAANPGYDLAAARAWAQANNDNASLPALNGAVVLAAGNYYLDGLALSGQTKVSVTGRVNLFVHGTVSVTGQAELNAAGDANDLWIVTDGDANIAGNGRAALQLFAPNSAVSASGNGQFAGRVLAKTVSLTGKALQPSLASLPPSTHGPKPKATRAPLAASAGNGTASPVASLRLDKSAPSVAPRGSSAASAPQPSGPAPASSVARRDEPREPKRVKPVAAPASGNGTASAGVASSELAKRAPERRLGGASHPAPRGLAAAPARPPVLSRRVKSSMPALALSARAAFATVGASGSAVRAKDRAAVVIPEGAATGGVAVTVSTPKTSDLIENRRQASVESRKGLVAAAVGVQYGPHGTQFAKPVTLELPYDRAILPRGLSETDLAVHYWNPVLGDWEKLESSVDARDQVVRAQTTHFSLYRIFGGGSAASAPAMANDPSFAVKAAYAFPNPSRHSAPVAIRIQPGLADSVSVRVYDLAGRLVHESSDFRNRGGFDDGNGFGSQFTFDHNWDVSGVASGVYNFVVTGRKAGASDIKATGKVGVIK